MRFVARIKAPSATGVLEDVSLDNHRRVELEFRKPYGGTVVQEAEKEDNSNDIYWVSGEGFLDEVGTWRLSANVLYSDGTYVKGVSGDLFQVVE